MHLGRTTGSLAGFRNTDVHAHDAQKEKRKAHQKNKRKHTEKNKRHWPWASGCS